MTPFRSPAFQRLWCSALAATGTQGMERTAGCVQVFDTPARQALVLDTVSKEAALRGLALIALAARGSSALGALAAGVLIPRIGIARCYLVVVTVYVLMALVIVGGRVALEPKL